MRKCSLTHTENVDLLMLFLCLQHACAYTVWPTLSNSIDRNFWLPNGIRQAYQLFNFFARLTLLYYHTPLSGGFKVEGLVGH